MIYAVASLLRISGSSAQKAWENVRRVFDAAGIELTDLPHISWHVAMHYDLDLVEQFLRQQARHLAPMSMNVAGIGVFSGENPVMYLPVTKTQDVTAMHNSLWNGMSAFSFAVNEHYNPRLWIPHVTLTSADTCGDAICQVVSELAYVELYLDFITNEFAIIYKDGVDGGVYRVVPFGEEKQ